MHAVLSSIRHRRINVRMVRHIDPKLEIARTVCDDVEASDVVNTEDVDECCGARAQPSVAVERR